MSESRVFRDFPRGMVWLVGAGPGDPELLTRKAARLIAAASAVFHDALVSPEILAMLQPTARVTCVGKRAGRHLQDQANICRMIVAAAQQGERVVRLKGGDPLIFGRATEELDACRAAGVPVAVCPGITAASAAAASLGCSLTLRGLARKLVFVTAHARAGEALSLDWSMLADRDATLAVYMGKAAAGDVSQELIAHGLPKHTPVAIVESASLPTEWSLITRLDLLPLAVAACAQDGPVILLIGQAMQACRHGMAVGRNGPGASVEHTGGCSRDTGACGLSPQG
ncbi:MAG: uroporphyrinogen-III C-methyltransferase [Novosphingobium sp.]|nr:uroporphyrinogen-III C-methyltransferase [Novosphingobium sp.]